MAPLITTNVLTTEKGNAVAVIEHYERNDYVVLIQWVDNIDTVAEEIRNCTFNDSQLDSVEWPTRASKLFGNEWRRLVITCNGDNNPKCLIECIGPDDTNWDSDRSGNQSFPLTEARSLIDEMTKDSNWRGYRFRLLAENHQGKYTLELD